MLLAAVCARLARRLTTLMRVMTRGQLPAAGADIPLSQAIPPESLFCPCNAGNAAIFFLAGDDLFPGLAESWIWPWQLACAPGTALSFLFPLEMCTLLPGQFPPCGKAPSGGARCGRSSVWGTRRPLVELLETRFQHFIKNNELLVARSR